MQKLVCDVCGNDICGINRIGHDKEMGAVCTVFNHHYPHLGEDSGDMKYDLCPNCTRKLVTFLDRKEIT